MQSPSDDHAQYDLKLGEPDPHLRDRYLRDLELEGDTLREECGVFGIFGHTEAAAITALGLHALQHRGQEAAGIVSFEGGRFHSERRLGLVGDTFSRRAVIERLPGTSAVGHVRYSTTGETILRNVQPLFAELNAGGLAVAHNGNLTNGLTLRRELVRNGAMMQSTTDTEVILHLVAQSKRGRFIERYIEALRTIEGAYALVSLTNKKLIGARDPRGIRPLVLGEQGLHVAQDRLARRRIADVADRGGARQSLDHRTAGKGVADQAKPALAVKPAAVERDDAGGFLAAVLQGVQSERGDGSSVGMAKNAEHAALLAQRVAFQLQVP